MELGVGVEAVGWGAMAEEGEAIGVETSGWAVSFKGRTQMGEMVPSGVARDERAGDDFAGVVVEREEQHWVMVGGPPGVGRAVVLPKFADRPGLPAAAGLGPAPGRGHLVGEMLADIGGDGGARTVEVIAAGQFAGQEGEIERLAVGQELGQEIMCGFEPGSFMIAPRSGELEAGAILQPLVAQRIEAGRRDHQSLGGGEGIEGAVIEGAQDFLDEECWNAVSELLFFIAATVAHLGGRCPQTPEVYRFEP